jgi:hypothetical protein
MIGFALEGGKTGGQGQARPLPVELKDESENEKVGAERGNVVHCHLDSKKGRPKKPRYPSVPFMFKQTILPNNFAKITSKKIIGPGVRYTRALEGY